MTRLMLLAAALGGCVVQDTKWELGTRFHVETRGDVEFQDIDIWTATVASAVEEWDIALGPDCPFPFVMTESDGRPVTLVAKADWPYEDNVTGMQYHSSILLRDRQFIESVRATVLHELGHAIGLEHRAKGEFSVMAEVQHARNVTAIDAADARLELGCD